ncbi:MAG: hypothetical protein ACI9PZ_002059 [Parvicella sp.]
MVNSWQIDLNSSGEAVCSGVMDDMLDLITTPNNGYSRGSLATPVFFAAGNTGAGWRKMSVDLPVVDAMATQDTRFSFHKNIFRDFLDDCGEEVVSIDNIQITGKNLVNFTNGMLPNDEDTDGAYAVYDDSNTLDGTDYLQCGSTLPSAAGAAIVDASATEHAFGGDGKAIKIANSTADSCQYLQINLDGIPISTINLTFNVWVSAHARRPN